MDEQPLIRVDPLAPRPDYPDDRDRWIVVAPAQARLHPGLAGIVVCESSLRPDIDVFYGDEVDGRDLILKPDFDLTMLLAEDWIGSPVVLRASAMHRLGGLRPAMGTATAYDLVLRAVAAGLGISRITRVLAAYDGDRPRSDLADRRRAVEEWLGDARDLFDLSVGQASGSLRLQRRFDSFPEVTVIVPTRQSRGPGGRPLILDLLDSMAATSWPGSNLSVLIGDDCEDDTVYRGRDWPFRWRRIVTSRPPGDRFNYAAKMNGLWRMAGSEPVVFVNDDIVIGRPDWLAALLTYSVDRGVGGVGTRLLYPDGRLQHAGIAGGLFGFLAHPWLGRPAGAATYRDWALLPREWSMVTGALFATRKSLLEQVNGFDERFSLEFNDIDLCLRLRTSGYRIVCTPFAECIHVEKASRGQAAPPGDELAWFLSRWRTLLADDPAFHPGLSRQSFDLRPVEPVGEWWQVLPSPHDHQILKAHQSGGEVIEDCEVLAPGRLGIGAALVDGAVIIGGGDAVQCPVEDTVMDAGLLKLRRQAIEMGGEGAMHRRQEQPTGAEDAVDFGQP